MLTTVYLHILHIHAHTHTPTYNCISVYNCFWLVYITHTYISITWNGVMSIVLFSSVFKATLHTSSRSSIVGDLPLHRRHHHRFMSIHWLINIRQYYESHIEKCVLLLILQLMNMLLVIKFIFIQMLIRFVYSMMLLSVMMTWWLVWKSRNITDLS